MTNRGRVLKALRGASKTGRTIPEIVTRDRAAKLTAEKAGVAVEQLCRSAQVVEVSGGRYALVDG